MSRSLHTNTSVLSSRSSHSASSRAPKVDNKCLLAFSDNETALAAVEEPLPVAVLSNIFTLEDLKHYW